MTPVLSAVFTVFQLIIFFTFVTLKLDNSIDWNWFLTFIPLFILQAILLLDTVVLIVRNHMKLKFSHKLFKLILFLISIVLIFLFEILLCLNLEEYINIKYVLVFLPFWIVFLFITIYLLQMLFTGPFEKIKPTYWK